MSFPLSLSDISLWLAFTAVILLVTSEEIFALPKYSHQILIDKKRLRRSAFIVGLVFLLTVAVRLVYPF